MHRYFPNNPTLDDDQRAARHLSWVGHDLLPLTYTSGLRSTKSDEYTSRFITQISAMVIKQIAVPGGPRTDPLVKKDLDDIVSVCNRFIVGQAGENAPKLSSEKKVAEVDCPRLSQLAETFSRDPWVISMLSSQAVTLWQQISLKVLD